MKNRYWRKFGDEYAHLVEENSLSLRILAFVFIHVGDTTFRVEVNNRNCSTTRVWKRRFNSLEDAIIAVSKAYKLT